MSPFACSIVWTFYVAFIQNRSTHLCPVSTCPFSLRRQTCSLSWGHTLAPGSPLPIPGLQCCPLSPQPFQTLPISQGLSTPAPRVPFAPCHSAAALVTCFSHFSYTHWYTASLCTGSSHCLGDGNRSRLGHLFLILFQPCST